MIAYEIRNKDVSSEHTQTGSGKSKELNAWHFTSIAPAHVDISLGQSETWVHLINAAMKMRINISY
jgi:hypothetical protein